MDCFTFLEQAEQREPRALYVLHGDEDFLKRLVLMALRKRVLGKDADAFGLSTYDGEQASFAQIHDELDTIPFLGPRRLVVVENADPFVTNFRPRLEKYISEPSASGVLVLDVSSWASNTRLAKMIDADSTIICKAPPAYRLPDWCVRRSKAEYGKEFALTAARLLVDLVGLEMGQLDQELQKLAIFVGTAKRIEIDDVDRLVGSSRSENTWKVFDAIGAGQTANALQILDRALDQGEDPMRILGAFSMQLRRLAAAGRAQQQGQPAGAALTRAGVPPFAVQGCEQQLRHLGPKRIGQLFDWLLEIDLGLKGSSQLPPRTLLERLVVRLASGTA
jgi:DNA polymerase-3 subunit delta